MRLRQPVDFKTNHNGWGYLDDTGYVFHPGFDFNYGSGADDLGMPVYTMTGGEVRFVDKSGLNGGWGEHVYISHVIPNEDKGESPFIVYTHYAHLQNTRVAQGDIVFFGDKIAEISNTGNAHMSPHLHFEIIKSHTFNEHILKNPEFYPTKRRGFTRLDVANMYYNPIKFINKYNMPDQELQGYIDNLKLLGYVNSDHDIDDTFSCGEVAKIIMKAHERMMSEVQSLQNQINNLTN